jgi:large repetitive protein
MTRPLPFLAGLLAFMALSSSCSTPAETGTIRDSGDTSGLCVYNADVDGDGFGNPDRTGWGDCDTPPSGYLVDSTDCDDSSAANHPGAEEICDGIDNDCDGTADEDAPVLTWYADLDGDGWGVEGSTQESCTQPKGTAGIPGDCDDASATTNPGAGEVCDGIDNDCDGSIDEDLALADWYLDADGDGFGSTWTASACAAPKGSVSPAGDCDDDAATTFPGATEACNGVDDNCNGLVDEGC